MVEFGVKFYMSDPSRLQEEYTRYQFYLQLKRNIFLGKLPCSINTRCLLASYTVQSELGDFDPQKHHIGYLSNMQLIVDQLPDTERKISELHKLHRGQLSVDAEYNYLEHARRLELYGIHLHTSTDANRKGLHLGVSSVGLKVFQNSLCINTFSWSKMVKVSFKRKNFFVQLRRELPENSDTLLGFNMSSYKHAKALWKSCVEHHSFFRLKRPYRLSRLQGISLFGSKFYHSGRTQLQATQELEQSCKIHKEFVRSPSKRLMEICLATSPALAIDRSDTKGKDSYPHSDKMAFSLGAQSSVFTTTKTSRLYDNKVTSKQTNAMPRKAWEQQSDKNSQHSDHQSPHLSDVNTLIGPPYTALRSGTSSLSYKNVSDVVTIRLQTDEQSRFGFNVKGGVDVGLPVRVSKVVPNTPAYRSTPRVCEGDEVVMINGHEVHGLKHDQVVSMIRDCRNYHSGELLLTLRQSPLILMPEEEPLYQYVPENNEIRHDCNFRHNHASFTQSLLLLSDGLASGALLAQYELMYRKNSDLSVTQARKPENIIKNRYRDISPYDCTRVSLVSSDTGDYINANYVNIEIPGGVVNRYIATQGPLASTTTDFWRMVQQESSHLVVMLTTVMEAGRQKCYQYWPLPGEELKLAEGFFIRCLTEQPDDTGSFVLRDLVLCDMRTGEQRPIHHMQYLAWPDHCMPSDSNVFLEFTEHVRSFRNKSLFKEIEETLKQVRLIDADAEENWSVLTERKCARSNGVTPEDETPVSTSVHQCISAANPPVIVHCSAGIGRTGVLILMDTALTLIQKREPIYPLDIVRTMRDQRAFMVQNASQYRFVCECICTAYMKLTTTNTAAKDNNNE